MGTATLDQQVQIGDGVIFTDVRGRERPALVTQVWSPTDPCSVCNLAVVELEEKETDSYGRSIAHESSVAHVSQAPGGCSYWRLVGQPGKADVADHAPSLGRPSQGAPVSEPLPQSEPLSSEPTEAVAAEASTQAPE